VWEAKGADRFLLDQRRERMNMPVTKKAEVDPKGWTNLGRRLDGAAG